MWLCKLWNYHFFCLFSLIISQMFNIIVLHYVHESCLSTFVLTLPSWLLQWRVEPGVWFRDDQHPTKAFFECKWFMRCIASYLLAREMFILLILDFVCKHMNEYVIFFTIKNLSLNVNKIMHTGFIRNSTNKKLWSLYHASNLISFKISNWWSKAASARLLLWDHVFGFVVILVWYQLKARKMNWNWVLIVKWRVEEENKKAN